MVDANHPYTLHHTYTGKGCAHCGKEAAEHSQEFWLVDGKQVQPNDVGVNVGSNPTAVVVSKSTEMQSASSVV